MRQRLHHRYSVVIVTLMLAVAAVIAGGATIVFGTLSERTQEASARTMSELLAAHTVDDGRSLALLASRILVNPLYRLDMQAMNDVAAGLRKHKGVVSLHIVDPFGRTLHDGRDQIEDFGIANEKPTVAQALSARDVRIVVDGDNLHVTAPVQAGDRLLGGIHIEMSIARLSENAQGMKAALADIAREAQTRLVAAIVTATLVLGIVGLLVGVLVARSLSRPIKALSATTRRIGQGDYDVAVPVERSDELGDLARDLRKMAADLKQAQQMSRLAMVGEMAVGVAHELNQPLNTIRMAADNALHALAGDERPSPYLSGKLELISTLAGRMGEQIQRMCAVGRRDERQVPFDPVASVADALSLLTGQLQMDGIQLVKELPPSCPQVMGSQALLTQAVLNLLSNARDAIVEQAEGPLGRLRPRQGRIRVVVDTAPAGDAVRIVIADNGGGVPAELRGRIFDPFFTTKEVNRGAGLGLPISYGIVSAMGGRIELDDDGEGAVFTITLPTTRSILAHAAE